MKDIAKRVPKVAKIIWQGLAIIYIPYTIFVIFVLPITKWEIGIPHRMLLNIFLLFTAFHSIMYAIQFFKGKTQQAELPEWFSIFSKIWKFINLTTFVILAIFVILIIYFSIF